MKKIIKSIIALTLIFCSVFPFVACNNNSSQYDLLSDQISALEQDLENSNSYIEELKGLIDNNAKSINEMQTTINSQGQYILDVTSGNCAYESYNYIKYIDKNLSERDCYSGENFKEVQNWIKSELLSAGYAESDIVLQEVNHSSYIKTTNNAEINFPVVDNLSVDSSKTYKKSGRKYVEDQMGEYYKVDFTTPNIIVTKKGNSNKQIIVGMHYDGDGTGDNGSGIALGLATAKRFCNVETSYTIKFVFFTAEEIGMVGSSFYANNMSQEEIDDTLYMINMDSLVCGDYCYLYGGVQDNDNETVNKTEAYDNAIAIAESLGLQFKSNPWTFENLAPENYSGQYPDYASPSTGDWSDHAPFANKGITYLYFEATNWEIPDYTGYGETYLIGMLMNTKNDYLDYIETYFPGRILEHLNNFSTLLNALLLQPSFNNVK